MAELTTRPMRSFLTIDQTAGYMGLSPGTIQAYFTQKKLHRYEPGDGKTYVTAAEAIRYRQEHPGETHDEFLYEDDGQVPPGVATGQQDQAEAAEAPAEVPSDTQAESGDQAEAAAEQREEDGTGEVNMIHVSSQGSASVPVASNGTQAVAEATPEQEPEEEDGNAALWVALVRQANKIPGFTPHRFSEVPRTFRIDGHMQEGPASYQATLRPDGALIFKPLREK